MYPLEKRALVLLCGYFLFSRRGPFLPPFSLLPSVVFFLCCNHERNQTTSSPCVCVCTTSSVNAHHPPSFPMACSTRFIWLWPRRGSIHYLFIRYFFLLPSTHKIWSLMNGGTRRQEKGKGPSGYLDTYLLYRRGVRGLKKDLQMVVNKRMERSHRTAITRHPT